MWSIYINPAWWIYRVGPCQQLRLLSFVGPIWDKQSVVDGNHFIYFLDDQLMIAINLITSKIQWCELGVIQSNGEYHSHQRSNLSYVIGLLTTCMGPFFLLLELHWSLVDGCWPSVGWSKQASQYTPHLVFALAKISLLEGFITLDLSCFKYIFYAYRAWVIQPM